MRRSSLRNKFLKYKTPDLDRAYKKQRNYTNRLLKKEKKRYLSNLDMKNITDNKKFWQTMKPFFGNSGSVKSKITLVEGDEVISDEKKVADTFSDFFDQAVSSLDLKENSDILNKVEDQSDPVDKALHKFKDHPSIIEIKNQVVNDLNFSFSSVTEKEMMKEIEVLKTKKAGTFMNIPTKKLKDAKEEIVKPLTQIWNNEILIKMKFPSKLKLADITPLYKKLEAVYKNNYRPVSLLPVVSKIFERIMEKQVKSYINKHLSPYLCGYRKGYNSQYALIAMIEKWKKSLDTMDSQGNRGKFGAILMDLSKAFDTINHDLLLAKLHA